MTRALRASATVLGGRVTDTAAFAKAIGANVPRGMKTTRIADADEDALTLAVAAARRLLEKERLEAKDLGEVFLVGGLDASATSVLAEALGRPDLPQSRFDASVEGTADALLVAFGREAPQPTLLIAAYDGREGPARAHAAAGAVAALVGPGSGVRLLAEAHVRRHRAEPGHVAHMLHEACGRLDGTEAKNDVVVVSERTPLEGAGLLTGEHAKHVHPLPTPEIGDLGPVAPLIALVEAASAAGADKHVVWAVPADHGVIAARFRVEDAARLEPATSALAAPATQADGVEALRLRAAWQGAESRVAQGAYVSPQLYLSQAPARYRVVGQRCEACQTLVFPPREGCPECGATGMEAFAFSGRGTVYARTRIARGGAPTEFGPLQDAVGTYAVAIVALDEGPRVAAMVAGGGRDLAIGAPVVLALRLLYVQEGMRRYGFKAVPLGR